MISKGINVYEDSLITYMVGVVQLLLEFLQVVFREVELLVWKQKSSGEEHQPIENVCLPSCLWPTHVAWTQF